MILKIKNLHKSFYNGEKVVLDGIDLNINRGEIFGLVGLNGIGKTTMIKMIIGLLGIDEGEIEIDGINSENFESKKKFCYLPEKFQPSQYLTGIEFLNVFCSFFEREKVTIDEAKEICDKIELDKEVLYMPTSQCSKGMGQKLGLISAFLSNTELLILDEPMSGLDPKSRIAVKNLMLEYKKIGRSIFFSSHILADIDEICDNIAILNDKKIIFNGSCEQFKKEQGDANLERAFLKSIS